MTLKTLTLLTALGIACSLGFISHVHLQERYMSSPETEKIQEEQIDPTVKAISKIIQRDGGIQSTTAEEFAQYIVDYSSKNTIDPAIILAIMAIESKFRANAVNPYGGVGLLQIVASIHKKSPKKLLDPEYNIMVGTKIFAEYRAKSRTIREAIMRYNGSYGTNTAYASKVFDRYHKYAMEIFNTTKELDNANS